MIKTATECYTVFNSPEELLEFLRGMPRNRVAYPNDNDDWAGGSFDQCLSKLQTGDFASAAKAQQIMDKLETQGIETPKLRTIQQGVVGFMPIVPNVLAGVPECMFTRAQSDIEAETTPVNVYVEVNASSGITTEELFNRGSAVLALVMSLATVRPIELYATGMCDIFSEGKALGAITRIETRPLDLARAAWILTSNGFARKISHSAAKAHGTRQEGGIPHCWGMSPNNTTYAARYREALNLTKEDIFIPGGWLYDNQMKTDPIGWVNKMVEKHTTLQEEN